MRQFQLTTPSGMIELRQRDGHGTPLLFLPGHGSDFASPKGRAIEEMCARHNRPLIHPAYCGYEGSQHAEVAAGSKGYIRHWFSQLLEIIDTLCPQPVVVVGHSMGAILMLQLARRRPDKVAALIGISAGFGVNGQAKATAIYGNSDFMGLKNHTPLTFTMHESTMVFALNSFPAKPIRLQYGLQDDLVSWRTGTNIAAACEGSDVELWLNKSADHSMSDAASLDWLERQIQSFG